MVAGVACNVMYDDCRFVERLKHPFKPMWVAHTRIAYLPDGKPRSTQTEKKTGRKKADGAITELKTGESWFSCKKLRKTRIISEHIF